MKVLVTGGAGFIGSHLVDRLVGEKNDVLVLDNLHRGKLSNIQPWISSKAIRFINADVRNYDEVLKACSGVEIVFHLAAQSNVMGAVENMDYSFESNVVGTFNTLKAASTQGVRRLIFSSSREVYGEAQYLPVDEKHPLDAKNPYGASKVAGEKYCQVFGNGNDLETVILRLANVYGERDFDRVIPIFIENMKKGNDIHIYGGKQLIDFVAVNLVADIFLQSMDNEYAPASPTNVGSGEGTSLIALAERIRNKLKSPGGIIIDPPRNEEVVRFTADTKRMNKIFRIKSHKDPLFLLAEMVAEKSNS